MHLDYGGLPEPSEGSQMSCDREIAIHVSNVSKTFKSFTSSRAKLAGLLNGRRYSGNGTQDFVALQGISFELERGKTFGIMGQNGSGKSTLLQIISGIMMPTAGEVNVHGRVAALLELGSGFNPEFSGLENVYLNASILGLSKAEIDNRLPQILDFAGIGDHVHLQVITYSSGMMLRLAFAVQVAIDPDVLIVDEALAVGDARFQLKCFRRLEELKRRGTTILFVSHATEMVKSFCDEALVLDKGKQIYIGDARTATIRYLETIFPEEHAASSEKSMIMSSTPNTEVTPAIQSASIRGEIVIDDIEKLATCTFGIGGASLSKLYVSGLSDGSSLVGGQKVSITADFHWDPSVLADIVTREEVEPNITVGIVLADNKGLYIFGGNGFDGGIFLDYRTAKSARFRFDFIMPFLADGDYFLGLAIAVGSQVKHAQLRWYDCFLPVRVTSSTKMVFGVLALDYAVEHVKDEEE